MSPSRAPVLSCAHLLPSAYYAAGYCNNHRPVSSIALTHADVRGTNFTTKPSFEIEKLRQFALMNSQGSRVEKREYQRTKSAKMSEKFFLTSEAWC